MSSHIRYDTGGGVATLTIDREEKKNALTVAMYEELREGLEKASEDKTVRVARVRGAGEIFTAGNDIIDFMSLASAMQDKPGESAVVKLLYALVDFQKPLVGEVRGAAIGIGTTMLLHFDLVYAGESARFHMPFTSLGLCPEGGSSFLLRRVCGHRHASQLLLLAEKFGAAHAREVGIVNEVVDDDQLPAHVEEVCQRLVNLPAASLRATKQLMQVSARDALKAALAREVEVFASRLKSPEAAEAFGAFMEKRKPDFSAFD